MLRFSAFYVLSWPAVAIFLETPKQFVSLINIRSGIATNRPQNINQKNGGTMAFDAYLYIDGIKGESTDSQHKDWIEVLAHPSLNAQPAAASASGGAVGGSAGRVVHEPFSITKRLDKASPKLYEAVSTGKHIPAVTIEFMRASGDKPVKYLTIKLTQVIITSVSSAAHSGTTPLPRPPLAGLTNAAATTSALMTESITFNYGSIQRTYTQQKRTDGNSSGNTAGKWHTAQGAAA